MCFFYFENLKNWHLKYVVIVAVFRRLVAKFYCCILDTKTMNRHEEIVHDRYEEDKIIMYLVKLFFLCLKVKKL